MLSTANTNPIEEPSDDGSCTYPEPEPEPEPESEE